ncbi:uncharacterized protein LOC112345340 [Selaginella moellendorffii]|uniref:uncharacterized protein LOC112345340 n=1 Tax=Selaginella moellendorffii TaxID=88036 RepID=UPI000D1CCC91|nr:uncharacterized protein LOC112345340 [Selaginella moellendorffii]|eukprot:XP_024527574.1 uncharacterized protein LOC112345340 [Selaginella moellendorffii]
MADSSWDDAALITAFNSAVGKYQERHSSKESDGKSSREEKKIESGSQQDQAAAEGSSQHADSSFVDPSSYYPYPFPQPHPSYPYPAFVYPVPAYACAPPPSHCCHHSCCHSSSTQSSRSDDPSFETLKLAILQSLSQLPPDKQLSLEDNAEVLIAWFNAGFRTASHLYKQA